MLTADRHPFQAYQYVCWSLGTRQNILGSFCPLGELSLSLLLDELL